MKINTNSKESELEIYLKIVDIFQDDTVSPENKEIWKNQSIIELMKLLERTQNKAFVTNALILILSLLEDIPPDLYNNRGHNINCISEKDKKSLILNLKNEFLPN
ncbi:MAG: hypothetical protein HWN81_09765 [Candidatus Lokiarchaeota archaeon]|nr:hypothetical protein [Candidatus Lokiarchaeota archaeon]